MPETSVRITNITGVHLEAKSDADVNHFHASYLSTTFMTLGIGRFFPNLSTLIYSSSNVKYIEKANFEHMWNLKGLWMDQNKIEDIPKNAFHYLRKLETINLSNNKIKALHDDHFVRMAELKTFRAKNNQIHEVTEALFANNHNLIELSLQNNKLMIIEIDFNDLRKLKKVDLRSNICIDTCSGLGHSVFYGCEEGLEGDYGLEYLQLEIERMC